MDGLPIELLHYIYSMIPTISKRYLSMTDKYTYKLLKVQGIITKYSYADELCAASMYNNASNILIKGNFADCEYAMRLGVKYCSKEMLDKFSELAYNYGLDILHIIAEYD